MEVRHFRARTLQQALQRVRQELGPEAAVLETRQVWDGWWRGLLGCRAVQVAAVSELRKISDWQGDDPETSSQPLLPHASMSVSRHHCPDSRDVPPAHSEDFRARFRAGLLARESRRVGSPNPHVPMDRTTHSVSPPPDPILFRLFTELIELDLSESTAQPLAARLRSELPPDAVSDREIQDWPAVRRAVQGVLTETLPIQSGIELKAGTRRVVAFIGPTGVGKTTTIAKLAANFRLRKKARVGLITLDTFRVAAVEQLRTYADILDIPMEVVTSQREMRESLGRLSECDLVMIDSAGRSPQDELSVQELRAMVAAANPQEIHLVLSATSSSTHLARSARQFEFIHPTSLLLTKLDEVGRLGAIYDFLQSQPLRLSYLTHGQNVPDDIQSATRERLGEWLTHGRMLQAA